MSFQITDEPEVQRLAERGHDALLEGRAAAAERLLDQAGRSWTRCWNGSSSPSVNSQPLCEAQVEFCRARGEYDGAEPWLNMWESVDPDHLRLDGRRMRVRLAGGFGRLFSRRRQRK